MDRARFAAFAIVLATACAGRTAPRAPPEPSFPLRIESARLDDRTLSVVYVLVNDSPHAIWVACPDFSCALVVAGRTVADGDVFDAFTGFRPPAPPPPGHAVLSQPVSVTFRRVERGETRWEANYVVSTRGTTPSVIELSVGILPCPEPDLLSVVLPSQIRCEGADRECERFVEALPVNGVHYARTNDELNCRGRRAPVVELQQLAKASSRIAGSQ